MRPTFERRIVAHLAAGDLRASDIASIAGKPRSTVCDWLRGPGRADDPDDDLPGALPERAYSYLLGFYLGDGTMPSRAVEIGCYSKRWPLLFPQHGPGRRHERRILLEPWQEEIVARHPRELVRGLIHSDGCRVQNRVNGKDYPRYFFTQVSDDIRRLFCAACRQLGVSYTWSNPKTVSVARAPSVALLDSFVGPKS